MAKDMNNVTMIGRLVRDCEISYTQTGLAIGKFSIANNNIKKTPNGYVDEVSFFNCTIFGKLATNIGQYLLKGKQIAIIGSLKQDKWVDKTTQQNRYAINIIVNNVQLLGVNNNVQTSKDKPLFDASSAETFEEDVPF